MADALEEVYASLAKRFKGEILRPGNVEFEQGHRIWNAAVQRRPALIARCNDVADVIVAVKSAAAADLVTAIRCGGHSLAGFSSCGDGLVIDLCRMRGVRVDEENRRARIEGGCLLGTIDAQTQRSGLAFPAGVVSHTGAAGLILGGGTGWLTRLHGLSCDNVERFTLVAADGSIVRASSGENEDLYWALRGGGGNFGVVVEFELRLHPLTAVLIANACYGLDRMFDVLRYWREFMLDAPDELKWNLSLRLGPVSSSVPQALRGRPMLSQTLLWLGKEAQGRKVLEQIRSRINSDSAKVEALSFLSLQTMADHEFPHGRRYYTKSGYFKVLSDETIETMIAALESIPSPDTQIELAYLGGAASKIRAEDTAFGDRSSPFILNLLAAWDTPAHDQANKEWVRNLFSAVRPAMSPGVYVNFMSGDEENRVVEAYRGRWERLLSVKNHYDPTNYFRLNHNIRGQQQS
ncbi:MAG TPA: FAD-binding oxidoreductase [Candidatus Acidoferrum sp.]|jgi:hypothetical protein|nr:FAD-binding oxidoreductase [Candidatus Acidoferrum sp.]